MHILFAIFLIFTCSPLFACETQKTPDLSEETTKSYNDHGKKIFGNNKNYELAKQASEISIQRLTLINDPKNPVYEGSKYSMNLANYKPSNKVILSKTQSKKLRELIFNPTIDDPESSKGCIPRFGLRVQFKHEKKVLDLNLCFECDIAISSRDNKILGGSDFDSVHKQLASLVKSLFPKDKVIQSLK